MSETLVIDGSHGEGGGQIVRASVALAAITGRPVIIDRVRAGRARPGLQPQHLASVRAAAQICGAALDGADAGSSRLAFSPSCPAQAGAYHFDIGTAGATTLVAQTVLWPLVLADGESRVVITGGTHVPHAPTADYLGAVFLPALRKAGLDVAMECHTRGFFPRGGGKIGLDVRGGGGIWPIDLAMRGELARVAVRVITSGLRAEVAERGVAEVGRRFDRQRWNGARIEPEIERVDVRAANPGAAVVVLVECGAVVAGFSAIGDRGKPIEAVAGEACDAAKAWWSTGAACDPWLADQLVLPMALADGVSRWTTSLVTEHLRTVLFVMAQFLPVEANVEDRADGSGLVTLRGAHA